MDLLLTGIWERLSYGEHSFGDTLSLSDFLGTKRCGMDEAKVEQAKAEVREKIADLRNTLAGAADMQQAMNDTLSEAVSLFHDLQDRVKKIEDWQQGIEGRIANLESKWQDIAYPKKEKN